MLYKSISIKTVLAKTQMSFQLQGNNWQGWALEWVGDALRGIGNSAGTTKKCTSIKIKNHKGLLPCDMLELITVEHNGYRLKLGGNIKTNHFSTSNYYIEGYDYPLDKNVGNDKIDDELLNVSKLAYIADEYYQINGLDVITTSFECGEIRVYHTAYPVDDEGFPLVPDTFQHQKACEFYILTQLCSGGYKHPVWDYKSADQKWDEYRRKAANKTIYPSIDSMDRFANMWVRQVADKFAPDNFFADSQTRQSLIGI